MESHDETDTDGDLANHVHQVHHCPREVVATSNEEQLELMHADDHDDLRRGIGG